MTRPNVDPGTDLKVAHQLTGALFSDHTLPIRRTSHGHTYMRQRFNPLADRCEIARVSTETHENITHGSLRQAKLRAIKSSRIP